MAKHKVPQGYSPAGDCAGSLTPFGMTFKCEGYLNSAQEIYGYWLLQNPTNTGSGCKLTPLNKRSLSATPTPNAQQRRAWGPGSPADNNAGSLYALRDDVQVR